MPCVSQTLRAMVSRLELMFGLLLPSLPAQIWGLVRADPLSPQVAAPIPPVLWSISNLDFGDHQSC